MFAFSAASFAFAIAERMHFSIGSAARLFENLRIARRLVYVLAANHIDDQPRLLRRTLQIFCTRCCFHLTS